VADINGLVELELSFGNQPAVRVGGGCLPRKKQSNLQAVSLMRAARANAVIAIAQSVLSAKRIERDSESETIMEH